MHFSTSHAANNDKGVEIFQSFRKATAATYANGIEIIRPYRKATADAYAEGVEIIQPRVDATKEHLPWDNRRKATTLKGLHQAVKAQQTL